MIRENVKLTDAQPGDICCGFELEKKQYVASKAATLYTMRHKKCGAELLYFDRDDENKTFCIGFKTLPEDDTGVFHILEHSVLNGSKRFPVKEPFVSLLQGSMQTFLNAMTYSDKTIFPVSSRSEQDLFNLMRVYLDGVFCPNIYEKPEIFMQEGWHYEFDGEQAQPYYNGVVFSEMKGRARHRRGDGPAAVSRHLLRVFERRQAGAHPRAELCAVHRRAQALLSPVERAHLPRRPYGRRARARLYRRGVPVAVHIPCPGL